MKGFAITLTLLTMIAIVSIIAYSGYHAVGYFINLYLLQDNMLQGIILSLFISLLLSALIIRQAINRNAEARLRQPLFGAKLALYDELLRLFAMDRSNITASQINEFHNEILLLADEAVSDAFERLQKNIARHDSSEISGDEYYRLHAQLVKAIRRDLGHKAGYRMHTIDNMLTNTMVPAGNKGTNDMIS